MSSTVKPVAVYKAATLQGEIAVGERICVEAVLHPNKRLNGLPIVTTPIVEVGNFGVFETHSTVYMPEERTQCGVAMSNGLTLQDKQRLYKEGKYKFKAPPVCTGYWDDADWIVYISACNGWLP